MRKIAIVLLNYNNIEDTQQCLSSIEETLYPHLRVLLVDNASKTCHRKAIMERFPSVEWIQSDSNLGYAGGNNLGIRAALQKDVDGIMILNNDTTLPSDFFQHLLNHIEPSTLYGGVPIQMDNEERIDHLGGVWNSKTGRFDLIASNVLFSEVAPPKKLDYIAGSLLLAPKAFFETVGLFDPLYFLFWEEADLCHRAKAAGYKLAINMQAIYSHKKSASIENPSKLKPYFWWRNRLYYIEKNLSPQEKMALFPLLTFELVKLSLGRLLRKPTKITPFWGAIDFFKRNMGPTQRPL
jgi:GT2 family glycosyltransferase